LRSYLGDTATLARKDLQLELRARDTLPAMLLFVLSILAVFHFALPSGSSRLAELGLLWIAILFTALLGLGRAFVAEREQGLLDALVLAPCDRSAIWLAKSLATLAFLLVAEAVALPAFALFFSPVSWELIAGVLLADLGICAVGTLLSAMAARLHKTSERAATTARIGTQPWANFPQAPLPSAPAKPSIMTLPRMKKPATFEPEAMKAALGKGAP